MKTNRLVLMAATLLTAGFAQAQTNENVVGLQWNESNTLLNLVTLNPDKSRRIGSSSSSELSSG